MPGLGLLPLEMGSPVPGRFQSWSLLRRQALYRSWYFGGPASAPYCRGLCLLPQNSGPGWRCSCPAWLGSCHAFLPAPVQPQGGPGSERILVPGEGGELLPQGLEAGPLLRVPVPARQHEFVCGRWALRGAGHAVARVHPQEGLVVGHACRGQDKAGMPVSTCLLHPRKSPPIAYCLSQEALGWALPSATPPHTVAWALSMVSRWRPPPILPTAGDMGPAPA